MNGILKCSGLGKTKNIGDYLQSVAQEQFWSHYDCFVERETLNEFNAKETVNLIMNAWFMHNPQNFPPAQCINPLFISFHISPKIANKFLTHQVVQYLKKYEPIGARDTGTQDLLMSKGIKSYFSGCLTLTLGEKYLSTEHGDVVFFVDPYYEFGGDNKKSKFIRHVRAWGYYLRYFHKIKFFEKKFKCEFASVYHRWPSLEKKLCAASFYHTYSKIFTDDVLFNAVYLTHNINQSDFPTDENKMEYARRLIKIYSSAKYVVTSRIHCALPCVGVDTPVIFVTSDALNGDSVRSSGRFSGLIDLLHVAKWTPQGVILLSEELKKKTKEKICKDFIFSNSDKYKILKEKLVQSVLTWQHNLGSN